MMMMMKVIVTAMMKKKNKKKLSDGSVKKGRMDGKTLNDIQSTISQQAVIIGHIQKRQYGIE